MWFQFFMWVVSFVLADYFRERLPAQTASGIGDFNIPTATEGRSVPIIPGGAVRQNAMNCIWYGDFAAIERTVTTGVIFTEEETIGFTYELALQYAICKNEVAGIIGIWIGDDVVFDHIADAGGIPQTVVDLELEDIFGGTDNGGGFSGRFRLFNGDPVQGVSAFLNTRLDPLPAYRGTCYVMITDLTETAGATIGESNNLRYIKVAVQAFDTVANGALGDVLGLGNDHHFIGPDANPISVAYDLYINTQWGRSFAPSDVDLVSFQAAAETIWTEGIGYSQIIDEQTTTGEIQDTIEQHCDAYIGPNAITGKIEVRLARQDYILANEFQANDTNIRAVKKWSKGDWSQTFNRIRLRYTDRAKQWKETHAVEMASGNRIIQGATITKELRYQGVHTASVAALIAARSKRSLAQPSAGGTVELDRSAYQLRPGDVFSFTSPKAGEVDLAVRITKSTVGNTNDNTMEFEVIADVTGTEIINQAENPPSDFVPPIQAVIPFLAADQAATEPPFILMRLNNLPNLHPRVATMARRAAGNTPTEYEVVRRTGNPPAGAYISTDFVTGGFMQVGTLRNAETAWRSGNGGFSIQVDPVAGSLDALIGSYSPTNTNAGGICVIDPGLATEEWLAVETIVDDLGGIRLENVWRGCMDTNMKAHSPGDRIWFIWTGGLGMGEETYAPGLGVEVKLLPRSPSDAVLEAAATALPVVFIGAPETSGRQAKPLHPVQMTINDVLFPQPLDLVDFDRLIVDGPNAGLAGLECNPQQRAFNTQGIIASVMGLAFDGTGLNPTDIADLVLESEEWLHDLDAFPNAERVNALVNNPISAQTTAGDQFEILKSDAVAGGAKGIQFNARLEVEITHSPDGQFPNQKSYESFVLDFIASGIFSLEPDQVIMAHQFNGDDGDVDGLDELARPTRFYGDAQIDTASSVYGGGSAIFDGTGDFLHIASVPGFEWYDMVGWTLDFRVRFDDIVGAQCLIGQEWVAPARTWYLEWDGSSFHLRFSRTGSNGPFTNFPLGAFAPNAGQWYTLRLVKLDDPSSPRFSIYIDGSRIGTAFSSQSHTFSGLDFVVGALYTGSGVYTLPFTGQIDEIELRPFAVINPNVTSYTVDTNRPANGPAGIRDCLIGNMEGPDAATALRTDDTNRWDLTFGATSEIDTAQFNFGTSAIRCDGVNSLTPASADGVWLPDTLFPATALKPWDLDRNDFTFEGFMRFVTLPSSTTDGMALIAKYNRPSGNTVDWAFFWDGSDALTFYYSPDGNISGGVQFSAPASTLSTGVWYHIAAQRRGEDLELYFNGNRIAQEVDWFSGGRLFNDTSNPVSIGRFYDASVLSRIRAMDGWIDGVRVKNGATLYNGSTYTIPTAPPAPGDGGDRNLLLLHHFEGADFFSTDRIQETDDGQRGTRITFAGGARYLDFVPKFGVTHGEMDDGDSFQFSASRFWWDLADSDFTIDIWFYPDDNEAGQNNGGVAFFNHWQENSDQRSWRLSFNNATDELEFVWTTLGTAADERRAFVSSVVFDTLFPTDTYAHVAVERDGSTLSIYVNGVLQTLDGASDSIGADVIFNSFHRAVLVGQQDVTGFTGDSDSFWDEFRITKSAEYGGSSFTPEVAAYVAPTPPNV